MSYLDEYSLIFFSELAKMWEISAMLEVTAGDPPSAGGPRTDRWRRLARSPARVARRQLDRLLRRIGDPLLERLSPTPPPNGTQHSSTFPRIAVPSHQINDPTTASLLEMLAPDILITNGAPILKPSLFTVPRLGTVNIHYGILPDYRGENTLFWALYHRDPERLGVTIHTVDAGVDTGEVLAWVHPDVRPEDSEPTLFARVSQDAARAICPILEEARSGLVKGAPQPHRGRLYLREERAIWHDAAYLMRRHVLNERLPGLKGRTVRAIAASEGRIEYEKSLTDITDSPN